MNRKWIHYLIPLLCLSVFFASCSVRGSQKETTEQTDSIEEADMETTTAEETVETPNRLNHYALNSDMRGIKILGERNLASAKQINCDWTGSGIEFRFNSRGGDMTFTAAATAPCYFRAYIDGEAWTNGSTLPYFTVTGEKTEIVLRNIPQGEHTVRLIKVTGYTIARAQITNVRFYGNILGTAPAAKERYIEFVGDSICCGWGTIGEHQGNYTDQDGTLAYPYLVAEALNADYSITALSGQGLLVGDPGMTEGYLYPSPLREKKAEYGFSRKPDTVVVNIGTNDYSYREQYGITAETFYQSYLSFLHTLKQKNGENCRIVCIYNTMNDTWANSIQRAVNDVGGVTAGIHLLEFSRAAVGHPTISEHAGYASVLEEFLRDLPEISEEDEIPNAQGMFVRWTELIPR